MSIRKGQIIDRFLAVLLSVMLVLSMLPTSTLSVMAATENYPNSFTVSITDGTNPLEGVNVVLSAKEEVWSLDLNVTTDENGVAAFETSDILQALTDADIDAGTIVYTASKTGYDTATDEIEITVVDLALNTGVIMSETQSVPDEYTLSVAVSGGDATVKLNGVEQNSITVEANEEVTVEITPADGSYIKSLTVGGEDKTVTKGETYSDTITVDKDIAIAISIVNEYTVTLSENPEGGTITLDGNKVPSVTVDENDIVALAVVADTGYQIYSVSIGGVAKPITDNTSFSEDIHVTADTQVIVTFVKVYNIEIYHNENGTVVTEPTTVVGGSVTVESGKTITITADPDDYYRVSKVIISDGINAEEDSAVTGDNYDSTDKYVKQLTPDKDYIITITFAPNIYKVSKDDATNGTINISKDKVDYNGSCDVTVTPEIGYSVSTIQVNGIDVTNYNEDEDGVVSFTISNISADTYVKATFVQTATISSDIAGLFNYTDAIRSDGMKFIYAKDGVITFRTDKTGIRIYDEKDQLIDGGKTTQSFTLNKSVSISKIQLRYKADGEWTQKWHDVEGVSAEEPLILVIDLDKTSSTYTAEDLSLIHISEPTRPY